MTLKQLEEDVPLKELLDGCICCTGSEKTEAQLQGLLAENDDIDVILIETTGAAHPVEALDAVYSPLFADQLQVKGIVTVADSKLWLDRDTLYTKNPCVIYRTNQTCTSFTCK